MMRESWNLGVESRSRELMGLRRERIEVLGERIEIRERSPLIQSLLCLASCDELKNNAR